MRQIIEFFRSTSRYANIVAFGSLAIWLLKVLWLNTLPGKFDAAYELGQVVEITLSQVVASYVFYLFFVHKQEVEDRRAVAQYVTKHATRIYGDCEATLAEISRASGRELDFDKASEQEVQAALADVQTGTPPNMVVDRNMTPATWYQYFMHQRERTLASVSKLLALGRLLSPTLASRIIEVGDDSFLAQMPMLIQYPPGNPTLEIWGQSFWGYLERCRKVKRYVEIGF